MTKILNFALKIKEVVGRVAHAKSSDTATPLPPPPILQRAPVLIGLNNMIDLESW